MILICENEVEGIYLQGHPSLVRFPGIRVRGYLWLSNCPKLVGLGTGLRVRGLLDLSDCSALTSLPDGLEVEQPLWLDRTVSLKELPKDLRVGWSLGLEGSSVRSIPEDAVIGGTVYRL